MTLNRLYIGSPIHQESRKGMTEVVKAESLALCNVNLLGFPGTACPQLSPPRSNSDSRQRFLPQGCRRMDVVQIQSSLAGSTSTTPLLTGVQPHGAPLATHAEEWNPQPLLRQRSGTGRHVDQSFRRDAITSRSEEHTS